MSQENVEIIPRLWLAYVRRDYETSTAALDEAVELSSDPRANMETGLVSGREAVVASIAGFVSSFSATLHPVVRGDVRPYMVGP